MINDDEKGDDTNQDSEMVPSWSAAHLVVQKQKTKGGSSAQMKGQTRN
jgi:hypothetical protein